MKRAFLFYLLIVNGSVFSQSTWIGNTNSMNDPSNWGPPGVPASGTALNFPPNAVVFNPNNNIGPFTLAQITAGTTYSIALTTPTSGPYTLIGNSFLVPASAIAFINIGGPGSASPYNISSEIQNAIELNTGTLNVQGGYFDIISGVISGSGTVNVTGGSLDFQGVNTYSGPTNINAGTLRLGASNTLPSTTNLTVGGILQVNGFSQTIGNLLGSGIIVTNSQTAPGSLTITNSGANTFSGIINIAPNPPIPVGDPGGTIELGAGSTGTLTLSSANSYSGPNNIGSTIVTSGTLAAGSSNAFGTNSNVTIGGTGTLNLNSNLMTFNTLSGSGTLQLGSKAGVTIANGGTAFSGTISDGGVGNASALTYNGTGNLALSGTNSYFGLTTIAGLSGTTPAQGGVLTMGSLPNSSGITFTSGGGTFQFGTGFTPTTLSIPISLSAATSPSIFNASLDLNGNTIALTGPISGASALNLENSGGSATLTISGENTYSGGTNINGGTLALGSSTGLPSIGTTGGYPLSIASGASFSMGAYGGIVSTLTGAGTLDLGTGTGLKVSGGVAGSSSTFSGSITGGPGGLNFSGNGTTLILNGTNTYSGPTTISGGGILNVTQSGLSPNSSGLSIEGAGGFLQAGGALTGTQAISLTNGSAPGGIDTNGFAVSWTGSISGTQGQNFTKRGSGTLTLTPSPASTYLGSTTISAGTLTAGNANAFGNTSFFDVKPSATLNLNNFNITVPQLIGDPGSSVALGSGTLTITNGTDTVPYYGVISGTGGVTITQPGAPASTSTTFLGTNTFTGTTSIQGSTAGTTTTFNTLNLGSSSSIAFGSGGGILQMGSDSSSSASLVLGGAAGDLSEIATNTYDLSISGPISGSSSKFIKIGAGTLTLTGANSFANELSLEGGTLNVTQSSLGTPSSITFKQFCGTLQASGAITYNNPINIDTTGIFDANAGNIALGGIIAGNGGISLTNTGTAGTLTLTGANTYKGITTIYGGTLIAGPSSLPSTPSGTAASPMLLFSKTASSTGNGIFQATGNFSAFPTVVFFSDGTIDTNGNDIASAAVVAGQSTATFTKAGAGTFTLSGNNIYTGPTNITGGTLQAGVASIPPYAPPSQTIPPSGALGVGSNVTISSGATLDLNGFSNSIGSLSGAAGSQVTLGSGILTIANPTTSSTTFAGNITDSGSGGGLTIANNLPSGKNGAQILTGTNTYSGPTTVNTNASLQFQGATTTIGSLTNQGSLFTNDLVTLSGGTNGYTQSTGASLTLDFASSTNGSIQSSAGAINLSGSNTVLNITNTGNQNPTGTVTLLDGTLPRSGMFTKVNNAFSKGTLTYTSTGVSLIFGGPTGCIAAWNIGSGNWGTIANWDPNTCFPGQNLAIDEDQATFPNTVAGAVSVTLVDSSGTAALPTLNLFKLNFTGTTTNYSIVEYMSTPTILSLGGEAGATPTITVNGTGGLHLIDTPIHTALSSELVLTAGQLTLGSNANITGDTGTSLTLQGTSGTLVNQAAMTPPTVVINGGAFNNSGTVSPALALNITGGTVTNLSGGVFGLNTTPIAISGGSVANNAGASFTASAFTLSGGTFTTQTPVSVASYAQQNAGTALNLDFVTSTSSGGYGKIDATGSISLAGNLTLTNTGSVAPPTSGQIPLLSGSNVTGVFGAANTSVFPHGTLKYSSTQVYLDFTQTSPCNGVWKSTTTPGNWGVGSNWVACVPGMLGAQSNLDTATFGNILVPTASVLVDLVDASGSNALDIVLNKMNFNTANTSFTIQQGALSGTLTFDGTSSAQINVTAGTHQINAPIALNVPTSIQITNSVFSLGPLATITGSNPLTIKGNSSSLVANQGNINPSAISVLDGTLGNEGTLSTSGAFTISGGLVENVTGGTLTAGSLTVSGGVLSTENQISVGSYTQSSAGTLSLDFPTLSPYGNILATGALDIAGTLNITNNGSVTPSGKVVLLDGSSRTGTFSTVNNAFSAMSTFHQGPSHTDVYLNFGGGCYATWNTSSGDWNVAGNWTPSCVPGTHPVSAEDTATFTNISDLSSATVTLNSALTALYQLNFNASNNFGATDYTISGTGSITMNSGEDEALISVSGGNQTVDVPIELGVDTILSLTGGSLTTGTSSAITGAFDLTVEGTTGTWFNEAVVDPTNVIIQGGSTVNLGSITPTNLSISAPSSASASVINLDTLAPIGAFVIDGSGTTTVTNFLTMSAGTTFTIGGSGSSPTVFSSNTLSSSGALTIESGTITNALGGKIFSSGSTVDINGGTILNDLGSSIYSGPGQAFTISGGTITNSLGVIYAASPSGTMTISGGTIANNLGVLGSLSYNDLADQLLFSGGNLSNTGYVLANNVQISGGTIINSATGQIFAVNGNLAISGGSLTNNHGAQLGAPTANLQFTGGTVVNTGSMLANNYTQSSPSLLELGVLNSSYFGNIKAQGTASLGGSLVVNALPGFSMANGQSIDLITALNGLNGTFDRFSFQNFPSSLIPSLLYLPNALQLNFTSANPAHLHGSTPITFVAIGQHNQLLLRKCEQLSLRLDKNQKQQKLAFSGKTLDESLLVASMSLHKLGASPQIQRKQEQLNLREERNDVPWSVYAGPIASCGHVDTKNDQIGFGYYTIGALAGFDYCIPEDASGPLEVGVGSALDYRKKFAHANDQWGSFTLQKLHFSAYNTLTPKTAPEWMFNTIAGFAYCWDDLHRKTGVDKQSTAIGKPHEAIFDILFDAEYQFSNEKFSSMPKELRCVPFVNLQYIYDYVSGYAEQGAGNFNLKVASQNPQSLTTMLGGRITYEYVSKNYKLFAEVDGGWQREYLSRSRNIKYTPYQLTSSPAYTTAYIGGSNSFLLGIDLLSTIYDVVQVETSCDFKWNSLFFDASFYLGVGREF